MEKIVLEEFSKELKSVKVVVVFLVTLFRVRFFYP